LNADNTVFDEISGGQEHMVVRTREIHARAYVASFGFKGSDQQKKVGEISGENATRAVGEGAPQCWQRVAPDEPTTTLTLIPCARWKMGSWTFRGASS